MFRNYFKTAYRSLIRNKSYALINIAGLAVGIAVCIIIFLIITFETSFDNFQKEDDQIFRVLTEGHGPDGINHSSGVPFPTPDALKNDFPTATIIPVYAGYREQILVLNPDGSIRKKLKEDNGVYHSSPEFFQVFNFPLIDGSALSLKEPNTVMLTQATAEKYFGDYKVAMGRTIKFNNDRIYKVTGIIKNPPPNTDFQMRAIMSYATLKPDFARQGQDWRSVNSSHGLFMKVPKGVSESTLTRQLRAFLKRYRPPQNTYENSMVAQSIDKIHYDDDSGNLLGRTISPNLIDMLKLIALFILVIACVNFINLSTAQAVNRSKEVGVRKVLGSNRSQLQLQFYCETIIIVLLSLILAIGITMAALPGINSILELSLTLSLNTNLVLFIVLIVIAVTVLAGFYPALVLSGYSPINALKSKVANNKTSGISLRRALVICQFVIAQALIIGTILIVKQMDYFQNSRMGFAKDAIITVPFPSDSIGRTKINFLRSRLSQMKDVQATSFSFASPADNSNWYSDVTFNHAPKGTDFGVNLKWADKDYVPLYNIELAAGRNLLASDTIREFLVNQTLLRKLGITNDAEAINKDMNLWDQYDGKIVGVVKDFHASSFRSQLVPVLISTYKETFNIANIKLA
jgi:ABC-type antimicrobial peptide transport system permease subunit